MRALKTTTFLIVLLASCAGLGDTITLKNGQVFEGKAVESADGVKVSLPYATIVFSKDEISGVEYGPTPWEVYKERAAKVSESDVEGHYELGLFCEGKGLISQARNEFQKVIDAAPNHAGARGKMGYVRSGDAWVTREQQMAQEGYLLYKGRYVKEEKAQQLQARDVSLAREREARNTVRTIAALISYASSERIGEYRERLAGISDPAALAPLIEQTQNRNPAVRSAVLLALLNYREDDAALAALDVAVYDPNGDIRYQARIVLNKKQNEAAFRGAVGMLATDSDDLRFLVSEALGAIGDPRAIPYLIEYLSWTRPRVKPQPEPGRQYPRTESSAVPTHVVGIRAKVAPGVVAYEPIVATYQHGERVILNPADEPRDTWNEMPADTEETILNYNALEALKAITGQDCRFDKEAWRNWYLANKWRFEAPTKAPAEQSPR